MTKPSFRLSLEIVIVLVLLIPLGIAAFNGREDVKKMSYKIQINQGDPTKSLPSLMRQFSGVRP